MAAVDEIGFTDKDWNEGPYKLTSHDDVIQTLRMLAKAQPGKAGIPANFDGEPIRSALFARSFLTWFKTAEDREELLTSVFMVADFAASWFQANPDALSKELASIKEKRSIGGKKGSQSRAATKAKPDIYRDWLAWENCRDGSVRYADDSAFSRAMGDRYKLDKNPVNTIGKWIRAWRKGDGIPVGV